jgi:putative tryptophan/tyrosine transport system substrate-binding protein
MASYIGRRKFLAALGGAAAAWPLAARAQQPAMPVIGFMSARSPEDSVHLLEAFRGGLKEGGFVENENVAIEFRWAKGDYGRLPALAAELVSRRVAVIAAVGGEPSGLAAKRATSEIPIVFGIGGDPVQLGLVASLNRPGGNVTGVTLLTNLMEPKRLGLLRDLAPGVPLIGTLINPNFPAAVHQLQQLEEAARAAGQRIVIARASSDEALEAAFASLVRDGVGALLVTADPYFDTRRDRIVAFAARQRLPAIYQFREYAVAGGLLSYGVSITDAYRQYGLYTARILKGAKPADLPVHQPTKFELVINVKTAKMLGLKISDNLLTLADEVIE